MRWVTATPISKPLRHSGADVDRNVDRPVNYVGLVAARVEVHDYRPQMFAESFDTVAPVASVEERGVPVPRLN